MSASRTRGPKSGQHSGFSSRSAPKPRCGLLPCTFRSDGRWLSQRCACTGAGHLAGGHSPVLRRPGPSGSCLFALPLAVLGLSHGSRAGKRKWHCRSGAAGHLRPLAGAGAAAPRVPSPGNRLSAIVTNPNLVCEVPGHRNRRGLRPTRRSLGLSHKSAHISYRSLVGARCAPSLLQQTGWRRWESWERLRFAVLLGSLGVLVSLPAMVTLPHEHGPRVFTPVWLLLAAFAALVGARRRLETCLCSPGWWLAFAPPEHFSRSLSACWVHLQPPSFTEATSRWMVRTSPTVGVSWCATCPGR